MSTTAIRYTPGPGPRLAFQVFGEGAIDVAVIPGFISHIEYAWQDPLLARFLRRLGTMARVIAFDKRGMGLSDRDPDEHPITMSDRVDDLEKVLDAVGSQAPALLAWSEGGPLAVTFAARHPDRTSALALLGTTPRFAQSPDFPAGIPAEVLGVFVETMGAEWGTGVGYHLFAPSLAEDERTRAWWASYQRFAATPGAVVATLRGQLDVDVRALLPAVAAPTLVVHRSRDMIVPVECGRYLADHIAGATIAEQDSDDHLFWVGHQDATLDGVRELLGRTADGTALRHRRPPRPRSGWESLTDTELDVVRLLARGMTNAQIGERLTVSPRTVQTHVTHVLAKLDLRRRAEVAAVLAGTADEPSRTGQRD
ncbi:MAG: alpha/beta fold hydrolase [Micropruina sp.]|uniref:alpha/beta fold hydrolase n=1 Tax=Micropruina sp. TaxID=2737536 RepID=UPI0039E4A3D5